MEDDAVIEALASEQLQALDMARREIRAQRDDDTALGGLHDEGVFGVQRHQMALWLDGARPWKRMVIGRPAIASPKRRDNLKGVQFVTAATTESENRS